MCSENLQTWQKTHTDDVMVRPTRHIRLDSNSFLAAGEQLVAVKFVEGIGLSQKQVRRLGSVYINPVDRINLSLSIH